MALNYPGYVIPQPSQTKVTDLLDLWDQGVAQGKADRYERQAPQQFANATAPLSEFGLTMPPDQMRALFANPYTRALALEQFQAASQCRADAYDPLRQLQIEQSRDASARGPRPPGTIDPSTYGPPVGSGLAAGDIAAMLRPGSRI